MKERLNLTIDEQLLKKVKQYAAGKRISVSELVEDYFRSFTRSVASRPGIVDLIENLPPPGIDTEGDLKKRYTEENASKYGF